MKMKALLILGVIVGLCGSARWEEVLPEPSPVHASHIEEYTELRGIVNAERRELLRIPREFRHLFVSFPYDYDFSYLIGVISVESNWNPRAISPENSNGTQDMGIAQLNSAYIEYFSMKYLGRKVDPFDPEASIQIAAAHLNFLYLQTDNIEQAVMAYNVGLSAIRHNRKNRQGSIYLGKVQRSIGKDV